MSDRDGSIRKPDTSSGSWLGEFPPRRWHLLLAGLCAAAVYLAGVTGRWWPTPDSALYLGLGRSLAEGGGYRFNGSVHNIVTPGLPMILAGLRILFGPGFLAPNLLMALCGLAALLLVYLTTARLSDRRMALAVTLAVGFSYTFFYQSHRILTDAPFAVLFWAILYAYLRYRAGGAGWLILAGLFSAAAIVIRAPGILILGPLAIGLMLDRASGQSPPTDAAPQVAPKRARRKGLLAAGVILLTIAALGGGFYLLARAGAEGMPAYASGFWSKATAGLGRNLRDLGLGLMNLPSALSEMLTSQDTLILAVLVGLPAVLAAGIGAVNLWRRGQRFIPIVIIPSVLALAFYGRDHAVRPRYLLPIQPLLLLAVMEGLCWTIRRFARRRSGDARPVRLLRAVTIFTALVIACNAPRLMRNAVYYTYLTHTPRYYEVIRRGRFDGLFDAAESIRRRGGDRPAATDADMRSIMHFLSETVIVDLPQTPRRSTTDAEKIHRFLLSRQDLGFVILEVGKRGGSEAFLRRLTDLLANDPNLRLVHHTGNYRVYEKTGTLSMANSFGSGSGTWE